MQVTLNLPIAVVLCVLPMVVVLAVIYRKRKEQQAASRVPFKDLPRRPAGETIRCKLLDLDDKLNDEILWLVMFPVLMAVGLFNLRPKDWLTPALFCLFSASLSVVFGVRLFKLLRARANYRLGYDGERFVGEELSRLIRFGFEVYHDVPFDGFNMDHVLVGPCGVFIVETKTRRKTVNEAGKNEFKVQFNGNCLQWPWGTESHGIEQAKNNAKTLSNWLTSAAGIRVWVTPILALPGWLVELKTPTADSLYVLNPKQICQVCASLPETLTKGQIQQICHQLDQKCRLALN